MIINLNRFTHFFGSDRSVAPSWHASVERWYQLDNAAYGLVDAYVTLRPKLFGRPDLIILASPMASNFTDSEFALGGAVSPSQFVHTLPNIRSAPLLQIMEWAGPVLCVQAGNQTVVSGLREAVTLAIGSKQNIWMICVNQSFQKQESGVQIYEIIDQEAIGLSNTVPQFEVIVENNSVGQNIDRKIDNLIDDELNSWFDCSVEKSALHISATLLIKRQKMPRGS